MTEIEKTLEKEIERQFGFGKAKIGLVVCAVFVVILAISSVWLYTRIDSLQNSHNSLVADYNLLVADYNDYVTSHLYTNEEYVQASFSYYYVYPNEQKFGVYDLEDELSGLEWIKPYQEGVFDCSEMSAYLEWYLENNGWHTKIYVGDSPSGSGKHAWLIVETSQGKYMPVESTSLRVVRWEDPNFDNYWEYDYRFETIQEALAYNESEFDWWK